VPLASSRESVGSLERFSSVEIQERLKAAQRLCGLPGGLSNCHVHVNWNRLINTIVLVTHLASCYAISVSDMRQARQPLLMALETHLIKSHEPTALHYCVDCSCIRFRHITFCLAKTLENHVHPTVHCLPHRRRRHVDAAKASVAHDDKV
jgi:hypothetical protein